MTEAARFMLDRRKFLASTAVSVAVGMGADGTVNTGILSSETQKLALDFAQARQRDPRLAAFANAEEFDAELPRIEGKVPSGFQGTFYRNGPGLFERNSERYRHWFDGDGFLQAWTITQTGIQYRGRFIETHKYRTEQKSGAFLIPTSGGGIAAKAPLVGTDSTNPSNTSVIEVDGSLWALWEGGSAVRIDPGSLQMKGYTDLGMGTKGVPFSAHPRAGADGRMWNVGSLGSRVVLYRLSKSGQLEKVLMQKLGEEGYFHDFILTKRSVVVVQCSTRSDGSRSIENGSFGSIRGVAGKPMRVHVFDSETLELTRQAELPSGFAFHFGNGWEDENGTIRFDICHDTNGDNMLEFFKPMQGRFPAWQSASYRVTLPKSGDVRFERLHGKVEFPKISPAFHSRRNRFVYATTIVEPARVDWFDAVAKLDLETGHNQYFRYGPDWLVEEHVFVPKPGGSSEDDGWLVGTALNWKKQKSALTIFDARHPDRGLLTRAWLDKAVPLGLHGTFVGTSRS
jgi:carotenoid cleavage dioxygenase